MKKLLYLIVAVSFTGFLTAQEWELIDSGTTDDIHGMAFKDQYLGFYMTTTGKFYKTINGGNSWSMVYDSEMNATVRNLLVTNDSVFGYVSSFDENTSTTYFYKLKSTVDEIEFSSETTTLGEIPVDQKFWNNEIWSIQKINQKIQVSFPGANVGQYTIKGNYISAAGQNYSVSSLYNYFYYSDDFGVTWQQKQYPKWGGYYNYFTFTFYDGSDDLVAIHGNLYDNYVAKSDDKGETWTTFEYNFNHSIIHFLDKDSWFKYGGGNLLYKTTDGGLTYESETLVSDITGILFVNDDLGFIYGENGMLYRTINDEDEVLSVTVTTQDEVPAEITTDGGVLQLVAVVEPIEAVQTVIWSVVEGTEVAEVDENGLVTALTNGVATIRAVSTENEYLYDEIDVVVDITASIESNVTSSVKIYPNPAKDKIYVEFSDQIEIQSVRIIDMQGKEVKRFSDNFNQLDLARIPKGLYFLNIHTKQGNLSEKILIE